MRCKQSTKHSLLSRTLHIRHCKKVTVAAAFHYVRIQHSINRLQKPTSKFSPPSDHPTGSCQHGLYKLHKIRYKIQLHISDPNIISIPNKGTIIQTDMQFSDDLRPVTDAPENGSRNRRNRTKFNARFAPPPRRQSTTSARKTGADVEFMATVSAACVGSLCLDGNTLPHTEFVKYFFSKICIQHKHEVI